jgi:hypothetical protein
MSLGEVVNRPLHRILMRAYDVEVVIEADDEKLFEQVICVAREALVGRVEFHPVGRSSTKAVYRFVTDAHGVVQFDLDGVSSGPARLDAGFYRFLNSVIRAHVGSLAKSWVFIHAGVVSWKGKAIILPGRSHRGKTTLVSEMIRNGAGYMSDEYAILDGNGMVHPFERDLGVRPSATEPAVPVDPGEFGGSRATDPVEAGMVVFTGFVEKAEWRPVPVTLGNGILEAVPEVIPFSFNTEFVLKVLNTTFNRAIIVKSDRGEARFTAPKILEYFDESIMSGG